MTREERILARRAEQQRLDRLAKFRADRLAWSRVTDRTKALRERALERARAQRLDWEAQRETLERQVERARLVKREEVRVQRSLAGVLEARRERSRKTQPARARRETVPRAKAVRLTAEPKARRTLSSGTHRAQRLRQVYVDRKHPARRQPDERAQRIQRVRNAQRKARLRELATLDAQSARMRRIPGPAPRDERLRSPRPRGRPSQQHGTAVQGQSERAERPTQRRAELRHARRAEVRTAVRKTQRKAARTAERRTAQRAKRVAEGPREVRLATRSSQGTRRQPTRFVTQRRPATAVRRALPRTGTLPALGPSEARETEGLSWLRTSDNLIIDENGESVLLRGVNVVGLDGAALGSGQTLGDVLALDDSALAILTGLWGVNVVRLPFSAESILEGTDTLSPDVLLDGLDQVIAEVARAGAYVLLALQAPVSNDAAALPDEATLECWRLLAARYQDEPGVLYEVYAASRLLPQAWPDAANRLIGTVRREHPAALIFVSGAGAGADVNDLPLRFDTGEPVHDLVYTVRFAPQVAPAGRDPRFRFFTQAFPVVVSQWSDSSPDLGRAADSAMQVFERYGIGWVAANWNADPRLVQNAAVHNYAATRFGNVVRRALTLPVRLPVPSVGCASRRWPSA